MIAVSMMRDEADICPYTVRHLIAQGCRVVVADNLSTDETPDLLRDLGCTVVCDDEPGYWQADKMNALIAAHAEPGEWVIPFDADELWSGLDLLGDEEAATAAPFVHVPQRPDVGDPNPCRQIVHRQPHPEPHPKVAFRYRPDRFVEMGNHYLTGYTGPTATLDVRHFQYRTLEQVARKVRQGTAAYDATDMPVTFGAHWRYLASLTEPQLTEWWEQYRDQPVVRDPAPWLL